MRRLNARDLTKVKNFRESVNSAKAYMSSVEGELTGEGWTGLTRDELLRLVLEVTPPHRRSSRFNSDCPTEAASKLIAYLIEVIEAGVILSDRGRRGTLSISQQLELELGVARSYVSKFKQGNLRVADDDHVTWQRLRKAFRWLLVGTGKAGAGEPQNKNWVDRLTQYFFEKEAQPSAYFARAAMGNGSPRGSDEGVFNVLWMADQVLHFGMRCCITSVSGELAFSHVNEQGNLSEGGKALVLAAAAGVRLLFIFPTGGGRSRNAEESAEQFYAAADEFAKSENWPWESDCVFGKCSSQRKSELRSHAISNIHLLRVPLSRDGIVPGYFTPTFRFTSCRSYRNGNPEWKGFFLIRGGGLTPNLVECDKTEEALFFDWCKHIEVPVDPTLESTVQPIASQFKRAATLETSSRASSRRR